MTESEIMLLMSRDNELIQQSEDFKEYINQASGRLRILSNRVNVKDDDIYIRAYETYKENPEVKICIASALRFPKVKCLSYLFDKIEVSKRDSVLDNHKFLWAYNNMNHQVSEKLGDYLGHIVDSESMRVVLTNKATRKYSSFDFIPWESSILVVGHIENKSSEWLALVNILDTDSDKPCLELKK